MSTPTLRRSSELEQYEWVVDGQVAAVLGYEERGQSILLLHTATDPALRRQGHATRMVAAVLEDVAQRQLVPSVRCPFVRAYLQEHPLPAQGPPPR